jgi:hypothetical protein
MTCQVVPRSWQAPGPITVASDTREPETGKGQTRRRPWTRAASELHRSSLPRSSGQTNATDRLRRLCARTPESGGHLAHRPVRLGDLGQPAPQPCRQRDRGDRDHDLVNDRGRNRRAKRSPRGRIQPDMLTLSSHTKQRNPRSPPRSRSRQLTWSTRVLMLSVAQRRTRQDLSRRTAQTIAVRPDRCNCTGSSAPTLGRRLAQASDTDR